MPRLRNVHSGCVVNVSDETAATLVGYEPAGRSSEPAEKKPAKKAAPHKSDK